MAEPGNAVRCTIPAGARTRRNAALVAALVLAAGCAETPADPGAPEEPAPEVPDVTPEESFGTGAFDAGLWVTVHPSGVYVTGYSEGELDGPHRGGRDPVIRKYHPEGQVLWADQFGSSSDETPFSILADSAGNAYVAGHTLGSIAGSRGEQDGFVRKYDTDGNHLWTRQFGTSGTEFVYDAALTPAGDIVVVGSTDGALHSANTGSDDAFVRVYSAAGDVIWSRQFGTGVPTTAAGVAVAADGSMYVVGTTEGDLSGSQVGAGDVFIRKYGPGGGVAWTRQFGTDAYDVALRVRVDAAGDIIVSGVTRGSLHGTNAGGGDVFLRKYTRTGAIVFTRQFGTTGEETPFGLVLDAAGNLYVGGFTNGDLAGAIALNDLFVRKYSSAGGHVWTRQWGTTANDEAYGIATADGSAFYVAGTTEGALAGINQGDYDAFLSQLDSQGRVVWTDQ